MYLFKATDAQWIAQILGELTEEICETTLSKSFLFVCITHAVKKTHKMERGGGGIYRAMIQLNLTLLWLESLMEIVLHHFTTMVSYVK